MKIPDTLEDHVELAREHVVDQDKLAVFLGTMLSIIRDELQALRQADERAMAARMELRDILETHIVKDMSK